MLTSSNTIDILLFKLTNNDSGHSEDDEGISNKETSDIILRDVLYSLLGLQRSGLDPGSDLVETTPVPLWVLPVALSHGCRWNLQLCYELGRT